MVAAGWLLRAWPVLRFGSWWRVPVDYDDAVYFAASALLWHGALPYRDFVLVHPPGFLLFLAPFSMFSSVLGAGGVFSLARWVATLVGAANIALSARIAHRVAGPVAAVAAAVCYAVVPETALHERSTYLEPVLNLACLLFADSWLSPRIETRRRAMLAGVWLGFALAVKAWAAMWVVASLASIPRLRRASVDGVPSSAGASGAASASRTLAWLGAGTGLALLAMMAPFLIAAPRAFLSQTVSFQLWRPPDGMDLGVERAIAIVRSAWPIALLALLGLAAGLAGGDAPVRRSARFFGAAWILTMVAFLRSPTYWPDYNAHLAPALAHLAGLGAAWMWRAAASRHRWAPLAVVALLIAVPAAPLRRSIQEARIGGGVLMERVGDQVRSIPSGACYLPFEPVWGLAGDRLPSIRPGRPVIVDVYGVMLMSAGARKNAQEALQSRPAQDRIRELLLGCDFLSLGDRGKLQLTPRTQRWIARRWNRVATVEGAGFELWRRRVGVERSD